MLICRIAEGYMVRERLGTSALDIDGWVQGNSSCTVLQLTSHQCSIHCERSCMTHWPRVQVSGNGHCRPSVALK